MIMFRGYRHCWVWRLRSALRKVNGSLSPAFRELTFLVLLMIAIVLLTVVLGGA